MLPKKKKNPTKWIIAGAVFVSICAYFCAAAMQKGDTIFIWYEKIQIILNNPFQKMYFNTYTLPVFITFELIYALLVLMYLTSRKNYLPGKEMGSAQYADPEAVNNRLADLSTDISDRENIVVIRKRRLFERRR